MGPSSVLLIVITIAAASSVEGQRFQFQLKGETGEEKVSISVDGINTLEELTTEWVTFSYPRPSNVYFSVNFLNGARNDDVYIRGHESQVADLLPDFKKNKDWGCGTKNENERCTRLRNGELLWGGKYTYTLKDSSPFAILPGRPFPVDGKYRTAGSEAHSGLDHEQPWRMGETPSISPHNPLNKEIGRYWLHQAEAEHASVASFARHTLQLMALGAPAKLLVKSQEASIDEIQHAKVCYGFASAFLGSDLGPGTLDTEGSLGSMEVKEVIRSLITEGCVGETLSALEVQLAAKYAEDPAVKTALAQIALDETRHSQLAWDTIQWILEKFPDAQSFAEEVFNAELEDHLVPARNDSSQQAAVFCQQSEKEASFHRYGLLAAGDREKVRQVGIKDVIEPVYRAGFKHVNTISNLITQLEICNL